MRRLRGKVIYDREGPAGWAVVVMPDYVLVDSYHGPPHVHTNPRLRTRDRKLPIRLADRASVLRVVAHVEAHGAVRLPLLLAELGARR